MFDLVIRNAKLVDGTGAPAREADIAIKDGLIARLAPSAPLKAQPPLKSMRGRSCDARLGRYSHPL